MITRGLSGVPFPFPCPRGLLRGLSCPSPRHLASALALGLGLLAPGSATAEGVQRLGYGRLVTNDLIGDGRDRWQSGSYAASHVYGRAPWTGAMPRRLGAVLEFRIDAAVSAPDDLRAPRAGDRPLAGLLRFGVATQAARGNWEMDLGAHVTLVGPETGLVDLQTGLHDLLPGAAAPSKAVRDAQLDLDPTFGASAEVARPVGVGGTTLRPFLAVEAGVETFARAGLDLSIGSFGSGGLLSRDRVTGHRFRIVDGAGEGASFVLGGDVTFVEDTALLRERDGVVPETRRDRLRAGMHWQSGGRHLFYGATWLSPETESQDSGQTVGSVRIDWFF